MLFGRWDWNLPWYRKCWGQYVRYNLRREWYREENDVLPCCRNYSACGLFVLPTEQPITISLWEELEEHSPKKAWLALVATAPVFPTWTAARIIFSLRARACPDLCPGASTSTGSATFKQEWKLRRVVAAWLAGPRADPRLSRVPSIAVRARQVLQHHAVVRGSRHPRPRRWVQAWKYSPGFPIALWSTPLKYPPNPPISPSQHLQPWVQSLPVWPAGYFSVADLGSGLVPNPTCSCARPNLRQTSPARMRHPSTGLLLWRPQRSLKPSWNSKWKTHTLTV